MKVSIQKNKKISNKFCCCSKTNIAYEKRYFKRKCEIQTGVCEAGVKTVTPF